MRTIPEITFTYRTVDRNVSEDEKYKENPTSVQRNLFTLNVLFKKKKRCPFQHHIIVEVGDTFRGHLLSPSLFKQGYLKQVCPGPSEDGFGISPRRETAQPPWVTCAQCLVTLPSLMFRMNLLCFSLCPFALLLSLGTA